MLSFFFIIGTHFLTWGSPPAATQMRCGHCGTVGSFTQKRGMRFLTLFFIVPVLPISGVKNLLQCQTCGTKYHS